MATFSGPTASSSQDRAPDPRPARTKAAILRAARELTVADGEVTVNDLAKRASVSRAAFYSHFSGLDDVMGAMLGVMFERQQEYGQILADQGRSTQEMVQASVASTVTYARRHHAFLLGALDWKTTHRTYLSLVDQLAELHHFAMRRIGDAVPSHVPLRTTAQFFAGGELDVVIRQLRIAAETGDFDAEGLLGDLLRIFPEWYTGLAPGDRIPVELIAASDAFFDSEPGSYFRADDGED